MLKIKPIRASLGKSVTAKTKNVKDDTERVIEFALSKMAINVQQISDLVACSKHERAFSEVAFVSQDAVSELRHFKKMELEREVFDAALTLEPVGGGKKLKLAECSLKGIHLVFAAGERCELSCKVWAPLEEHALYMLSEWGPIDLFVGIESKKHGEEDAKKDPELQLGDAPADASVPTGPHAVN